MIIDIMLDDSTAGGCFIQDLRSRLRSSGLLLLRTPFWNRRLNAKIIYKLGDYNLSLSLIMWDFPSITIYRSSIMWDFP
jgi:hypothetical protein